MAKTLENAGDRIRRARGEAEITQQQLADYIGISRAAVAQWENGDTKGLKAENVVKAAKRLGKNAEWLVLGTGPESPAPDFAAAISELPDDNPQQVLDFLQYRFEKADGLIASEKVARYVAMIEDFKQDLDKRKKKDSRK